MHDQCPARNERQKFLDQEERSLLFHLDQDLRSHCVLCCRWFRFPRSLSKHLKASHPATEWGSLLSEEGDWYQSQCELVTAPGILVVHLQRFSFSRGSVRKNNRAVILEDVTELALASGENVRYRLLALLAHHGTSACAGHYTAYVRDNGDDAGFLHCDDMRVSSRRIGVAELVEALSCEAYMLFLQRSS